MNVNNEKQCLKNVQILLCSTNSNDIVLIFQLLLLQVLLLKRNNINVIHNADH